MDDLPRIKYEETRYDLDTVLDKLEVHNLLQTKYKNDTRILLSKHPHSNTILGLLNEFDNLRYYFDNDSINKKERIGMLLLQLDSPLLLYP